MVNDSASLHRLTSLVFLSNFRTVFSIIFQCVARGKCGVARRCLFVSLLVTSTGKNASAYVLSCNFQNASKLTNTNSYSTFRSKAVHTCERRGVCGAAVAAAAVAVDRDAS
jgi:hypothetical protein